jgi:RHS repeat-associated protein
VKVSTGEIDFIPFRFQGQYHDKEVELYYNRFRYYDSETSQYTQQDPIGLLGGNPTLYGYVKNPLVLFDPFGLYEVFLPFDLKPSNYFSSDAVQFRLANQKFFKEMINNPIFRKNMFAQYPQLRDWCKSPNMSRSPSGLTWHHSLDKTGRLELVDFADHNSNSSKYHGKGGIGGREVWGGGDAGRRGKLYGATGKRICPS